ncbi:hypothetical protein PTTG_03001 [Puccinia triticina 1-1 BBBD Race 1]|uniref:CxC1 domain-containing protein n=1 Tax=Puccinia triticina (isolate 1-1 / race 1 (BBBD)) TaxID=630390 RepID=A0A180G286_PUCT1|nr:hypothetical protein PTTG_03001 [Puccinia triticina 1-1 BBBD Race 1]
MPSRRRTGFALRRAPTSVRNRRAPVNLQTPNNNDGARPPMRADLLLIPRRPDQDPHVSPPAEPYHDDFHRREEPNENDTRLPPEIITEYAIQKEKLSAAWKSVEKSMTAAYYTCQYRTQNWTSSLEYLDPLDKYQSPAQKIEFCLCIPDPVRLLYHGYFAASPTKPRTAFAIPLVQLYQSLWYETAVPYTSFIKGLVCHQETRARKPLLARSRLGNPRELRTPFSQAIDIYSRIQILQKDLLNVALQMQEKDFWASKCPSCFGPEKPDEVSQADDAYAIIAMDGNFQHRHHHFASNDVPTESDYPSIFIPPSQINNHEVQLESTEGDSAGLRSTCSDSHKAANDVRNSSSWDKFDDTGLFGSCCRHDIPLKLTNIEGTGEKLYYPVSILDNILNAFPSKKIGVLYDIGCHLDAHRNLLGRRIDQVAFGTSVFHAYVHNWACQIKYNPRYNTKWGLSNGEGMERLWSGISDLVGPLRSATRIHRLQAIARQCAYYTAKLKHGAVDWMHEHLQLALESIESCSVKLQEIYQHFNHYCDENYTPQFLEAQWIAERNYYSNRDHAKEEQKLELGRLLVLEQDLIEAWEEIRTPEEALARLRFLQEIQSKIDQQRERVGVEEVLAGVTAETQSQFLKVWWAKTELRQKFLALVEEKRPLDVVRKGLASKLGTDGKEKLVIAIRKRTAALQTVLNTYNRHVDAFHLASPPIPTLPRIEYDELMRLEADSPFWNDGVFTNHDEPWAVDADTQDGMRLLARLTRGEEEVQRIGQEIRRATRWAVTEHKRIVPLMFGLSSETDWVYSRLQPVTDHPILQSLSSEDQIDPIKAILHNYFIEISSLQLHWNSKVVLLVSNSGPYENDAELVNDWNEQIMRLNFLKASGYLSMVRGDFDNAIGNSLDNVNETVLRNFLSENDASGEPSNTQDGRTHGDLDDDDDDDLLAPIADQVELALEQEALNNALADGKKFQCSIFNQQWTHRADDMLPRCIHQLCCKDVADGSWTGQLPGPAA